MAELDRRDFLKLAGVGAGAAAATGCYRAADLPEQLIPYVVQPEEITPGIANYYASTSQECAAGCGVHVRTREGRPVKLEGNPDHPVNRGALCARCQASIGRTYHPDRFRAPQQRGADGTLTEISWEDATALLARKLASVGSRARFLGSAAGPSLSGLIDAFVAATGGGERVSYEAFSDETLRAASEAVFGSRTQPLFDLSGTDYVIDFGSDALDTGRSPVEHARQLAEARDITSKAGKAARLVYVGPRLDSTAGRADEWLVANPGTEGLLALGIARVALEKRSAAGQPVAGDVAQLRALLQRFDPNRVAQVTGVSADAIRRIGDEIATANRAVALPPGSGLSGTNALGAHAAVLILDAVIGAVGTSVSIPASDGGGASPYRAVEALVADANAGRVSVLLIHGTANPAYSLPPALGAVDAFAKVDFVVSFASLPDETTELADLILPDHTPLESWGDAAPRPGVRSVVQPTLRPLYKTQALGDTLLQTAGVLGDAVASQLPAGSFRHVVEANWSDTDWREALGRGGVFSSPAPREAVVQQSAAALKFEGPELAGSGEFVLLANPSPLLGDGRGAALSYLQETPDPVTKIAWQSWLEVSRDTAKRLGINEGDVVAIETAAGKAELPIFPRGGIRDDVVALATGQGHTVGLYASREKDGKPGEARGVNVVSLLPAATDASGAFAWLSTKASVAPTGAHRRLPNTQRSDNKRGRQLGEAISLAALARGDWNAAAHGETHGRHGERDHGGGNWEAPHGGSDGDGHADAHGDARAAAAAALPAVSAAAGHEAGKAHEIRRPYDPSDDARDTSDYRWGMTIDLDRCNGCSACVVACSIENNVPIVGEDAVLRNRGMNWLRIERYIGDGEQELLTGRQRPDDREQLGDTDVRSSPMLCQQCGAAPCEPVCPVIATYHNDEGMNAMIYNRCIGTRYCSNNCPYKVRRYNWFDYGIHNWPDPMRLGLNPDVTVRGQGVMEKCTFCIQRVQTARQTAKDQDRPIADGEVKTACQQTCPTQAISFGNLRDENSVASKKARESEARAYHALHFLNTRPGITYLAKVKRVDDGENHG